MCSNEDYASHDPAHPLALYVGENAPPAPSSGCPMMPLVGRCNFVTRLRSNSVSFSEHSGPLSIKCAVGGQEWYEVGGARLAVDDGCYLVLNSDEAYSSEIATSRAMESFCIWFETDFAEEVLGSLSTPADRMLDEPGRRSRQPVTFLGRITPHDILVSPVLRRIYAATVQGGVAPNWLEEQFHLLLERLLQVQRGAYSEIATFPAARASTRAELYRRLSRAKDYLDSTLEAPVTLGDRATSAAMSRHHFLRLFKQAYNETPGHYRSRRRLERAATLIARTDRPITDICIGLGFQSLGTFSGAFRRLHGVSPREFRALGGRRPEPVD